MDNNNRRVVITGIGPVTSVGIGKESFWESLTRGKSAFRRIEFPNTDMTMYRSRIAAPIDGFDLFHYVERTKHSKYFGRTSRFAVAGTALALRDAGIEFEKGKTDAGERSGAGSQYHLKGIDPFQIGVILGVGGEAMDLMEHYHQKFLTSGTRFLTPFGLPNTYLSSFVSHVAEHFSLRGSAYAVSTACASGTHAVINSFREIHDGGEDLMVTGGADACITPLVFIGFDIMRAMSIRNENPEKACRPFDRNETDL